jgi:hypothetical protein
MPGECRKRLDPCPNGAGHPSIADCQATARLLDRHRYLGRSSGTAFGSASRAERPNVVRSVSGPVPGPLRAAQMNQSDVMKERNAALA